MPSKLQNLDNIFGQIILRIPDYQRGYSWEKKHLEDLWNDIRNINPNSYHFTGHVTFEGPKTKTADRWSNEFDLNSELRIQVGANFYQPYFVVDGQQRLVSLIMLISLLIRTPDFLETEEQRVLLEKYIARQNGHSAIYLFGYEKDTPSHQYLIGKIFEDPHMQITEPETVYTNNLAKTKEFFHEKLMALTREQKVRLLKKITHNFMFNVFEINSDQVDMSLVFETLNYRGKPLSCLEIFKNRLIFLITKRHVPAKAAELRTLVIKSWQDIYEWLGKNPKVNLKDDDFLKAFWVLYFNHDATTDDDFKKWETDIFDNKYRITEIQINDLLREPDIKNLLRTLSKAIKAWYFIHNPETTEKIFDYDEQIRLLLQKLHRNSYGEFMKPLITCYFIRDREPVEIVRLLTVIERHNFCVYYLAGKQSDTNRPEFLRMANKFLRRPQSIEHPDVISEINLKTNAHCTVTNFYNHIYKSIAVNKKFYSWKGIKYLLWEYEDFLRNGNTKLIGDYSKANIDPVFPVESPAIRNDSSFERIRRKRDNDSLEKLGYSLGNLTITQSHRQAQSYPNYRLRLFEGSYTDRNIASTYQQWTDETILHRGLTLLRYIENRWSVDLGNDQQKRKILLDGVQVEHQEIA